MLATYGEEDQSEWNVGGLLSFFLLLLAGTVAWGWAAVDAGKWTARLVLRRYGVICLWWALLNAYMLFWGVPVGRFANESFGERLEAMADSLAAGPWTALYYIGSLDFIIVIVLMLIMIAVGLRWPNLRFTRICGYVGVCIWFFLGMGFVF